MIVLFNGGISPLSWCAFMCISCQLVLRGAFQVRRKNNIICNVFFSLTQSYIHTYVYIFVDARVQNMGQNCAGPERFIVFESIYDQFCDACNSNDKNNNNKQQNNVIRCRWLYIFLLPLLLLFFLLLLFLSLSLCILVLKVLQKMKCGASLVCETNLLLLLLCNEHSFVLIDIIFFLNRKIRLSIAGTVSCFFLKQKIIYFFKQV